MRLSHRDEVVESCVFTKGAGSYPLPTIGCRIRQETRLSGSLHKSREECYSTIWLTLVNYRVVIEAKEANDERTVKATASTQDQD